MKLTFSSIRRALWRRRQTKMFADQASAMMSGAVSRHLIPEAVFADEKLGSFLAEIGFEKDHPDNLLETIPERLKRGREVVEQKTSLLNTEFALRFGHERYKVRPFYLIQDGNWQDEDGLFLLQELQLSPFDDWNVIYLSEGVECAQALKTPPHPTRVVPDFEKAGRTVIERLRDRLSDEIGSLPPGMTLETIKATCAYRAKARDEVLALAHSFSLRMKAGFQGN